MLKKAIIIALTTLAIAPAMAATENMTIDSSHTFPSFEVNHFGFSTQRGRFNDTKGTVQMDVAKQTGKVNIIIKTASISTGNEALEKHLRSADFFDADKFPEITYSGDLMGFVNGGPTMSHGMLTMKGVTKPVMLRITNFNKGVHPFTRATVYGIEASVTVKRSDFGISYALPGVSDDVKLLINAEASVNQ